MQSNVAMENTKWQIQVKWALNQNLWVTNQFKTKKRNKWAYGKIE